MAAVPRGHPSERDDAQKRRGPRAFDFHLAAGPRRPGQKTLGKQDIIRTYIDTVQFSDTEFAQLSTSRLRRFLDRRKIPMR